jgi:hypothetical protein
MVVAARGSVGSIALLVAGLIACVLLNSILADASAKPLFCDHCGREIVGQYTVYNNRNLHDSCYYRYYARFCTLCGGVISGQYIYNSWGDVVHAVHIGEYARCEYCGRLKAERLTGTGVRYGDGREICGICLKSAVTDVDQANLLLDTVRNVLYLHGIEIEDEFALHLVDKYEMVRINPDAGHEARGYTGLKQHRALFGLVKAQTIKVYVLTGMPRAVLMGVLAHELMHVWLFTNGPLDMDDALCEGSCEYASYLTLRGSPDKLAQYYLENQAANEDLVYGGGFRSVSGYVERVGVEAWLDYLRTHSQPPWD